MITGLRPDLTELVHYIGKSLGVYVVRHYVSRNIGRSESERAFTAIDLGVGI